MVSRNSYLSALSAFISTNVLLAGEIPKIPFKPISNVDRAEVYYIKEDAPKGAVLVLCPGFDEDGSKLITDRKLLFRGCRGRGVGVNPVTPSSQPFYPIGFSVQ